MLNNCVSRSVMLRTGSSTHRSDTVAAPSLVGRHRKRRQQQSVASVQRVLDLPRQHLRVRAARERNPRRGCSGPSRGADGRSPCSPAAGFRACVRDRRRLRAARCARRSARSPSYERSRHRRAPRPPAVSRSQASSNRAATCGSSSVEEVRARDTEPQTANLARRGRDGIRHAAQAHRSSSAASSTDRHSGPT